MFNTELLPCDTNTDKLEFITCLFTIFGIICIPLIENLKIPLKGLKWEKCDYETLYAKIEKESQNQECLNYGIIMGTKFMLVDIDLYKLDQELKKEGIGKEVWNKLLKEYNKGQMIDTVTINTPRKGIHLIFEYDQEVKPRNGYKVKGLTIDVKSGNSYCVGPGSQFEGKFYQAEPGYGWGDKAPNTIPRWLKKLILKDTPKEESEEEFSNSLYQLLRDIIKNLNMERSRDHDTCRDIIWAIRKITGPTNWGLDLAQKFAKKCPKKYREKDNWFKDKWERWDEKKHSPGWPTLIKYLQKDLNVENFNQLKIRIDQFISENQWENLKTQLEGVTTFHQLIKVIRDQVIRDMDFLNDIAKQLMAKVTGTGKTVYRRYDKTMSHGYWEETTSTQLANEQNKIFFKIVKKEDTPIKLDPELCPHIIYHDDGEITQCEIKKPQGCRRHKKSLEKNKYEIKNIGQWIGELLGHNSFEDFTFEPVAAGKKITSKDPDTLNIFPGFVAQPILHPNHKQLLEKPLKHIKEVLANNNSESYEFILNILAHMVQYPHIKNRLCLSFCSIKGAGKNIIFDLFIVPLLFGNTLAYLTTLNDVNSRFNGLQKYKLLLILDEFSPEGSSHNDLEKMKINITGNTRLIEDKYMKKEVVTDFATFFIFTNYYIQKFMKGNERRYAMFYCGDKYRGNKEYFDQLKASFTKETAEALMYELVHRDLTHFDPTKAPKTKILEDNLKDNCSEVEQFIIDFEWSKVIDKRRYQPYGILEPYEIDGEEVHLIEVEKLHKYYILWHKDKFAKNTYVRMRQFIKELKDIDYLRVEEDEQCYVGPKSMGKELPKAESLDLKSWLI